MAFLGRLRTYFEDEVWVRNKVVCLSSVLIACGFAEFISSVFVIYYSGGNYMGGIYVGTIALAAGLTILFSNKKSLFGCVVLFAGLLAVSFLSIFHQIFSVSYVNGIESCASSSSGMTTSGRCKQSYFYCYGKSRDTKFIDAAQHCESRYVDTHGKSDLSCSCVQRDTLSCYTYTNVPSCRSFTHDLPKAFIASFSFTIIVIILSAALLVISMFSYFQHASAGKGSSSFSRRGGYIPLATVVPIAEQSQKSAVVYSTTKNYV